MKLLLSIQTTGYASEFSQKTYQSAVRLVEFRVGSCSMGPGITEYKSMKNAKNKVKRGETDTGAFVHINFLNCS